MVGGYELLDMSFADGASILSSAVIVPKSIQKKIERMVYVPIGSNNGTLNKNARQKPIYVKWNYDVPYVTIGILHTSIAANPELFTDVYSSGDVKKRTYTFLKSGDDDLKVFYTDA